ncbi:DMT family transporter [Terrimonas sp. NA20]|uniref:DMT family transporter n=1 Tax=Terrimonas ginsenosidimutans TaxID=2908004 RepID=A0ABS9KLV8_9BACT|nr:DMT family transporter [Terrimonas ginsenosidimutans]MCG2613318.1 DMT family transporter [Terrimonas ginsenosidimutans]
MQSQKTNRRHIFTGLLILGTAFWGISFPVTKMAVSGVSQSTFLFYRFLLATLILTVIFFRQVKSLSKKSFAGGISLAIPLILGIYLQTLALKHTSASQCAFIAGMCVIVIPVLKLIVYRTSVDKRIWLAAIVAMAGLFIISVNDRFSIGAGDLYTIAGSCFFAVYLIHIEKYSEKNDIIPTIVPMFLTCTLIMLCVAAADSSATWLPETKHFWPGILYCAFFATAYMYTISNISQRYIKAEKVALIYLFEPVFAAVASFFILDEIITTRLILGGLLIFAGTIISEMKLPKTDLR